MLRFKDTDNKEISLKDFLELKNFNGSIIFDLNPQDKAETCLDYIEIKNNKLTAHSYDTGDNDTFKLKSKKSKEYIQIMRNFSDSTTVDSVIMHYKKLQKSQKQSLKL